jgi:hypothetical protein
MIAAASFIPAFRHNYGRDKSLKYFSTGLLSEKITAQAVEPQHDIVSSRQSDFPRSKPRGLFKANDIIAERIFATANMEQPEI